MTQCWRAARFLPCDCPECGADMQLKVPTRRQRKEYDCGVACVRAICEYFGVDVPDMSDIASRIDGTDRRNIEHVLRKAKLAVQSGTMTIGDLRHHVRNNRPVILLVQHGNEGGHYVVLRGIRYSTLALMDPANGPAEQLESELLRRWYDIDADGFRHERWAVAVGI